MLKTGLNEPNCQTPSRHHHFLWHFHYEESIQWWFYTCMSTKVLWRTRFVKLMETMSGEGQLCHTVMNIKRKEGGDYGSLSGDYIKQRPRLVGGHSTWQHNEGKTGGSSVSDVCRVQVHHRGRGGTVVRIHEKLWALNFEIPVWQLKLIIHDFEC